MPPVDRVPGGLMPFWMLCDASTVSEKIAFMRRCRAGGIKALTLHPRPGNLIPFASGEWFAMIRALVAEAARLDMKLWLYDEDPYPSGAAGGLVMTERPDLRGRALGWVEKPASVKPGELWFISRRRVLWAGLVPTRAGAGAPIPLTAEVGPVRADWFAVDWDSRYYYDETPLFPCVRGHAARLFFTLRAPAVPAGYTLGAVTETRPGADGPWGSLPDLLNPETFPVFQRFGLDPYADAVGAHFGGTVPGIFTDEAKPHGGVPFTADLFASFHERFGYDLADRLHHLFGNPLDESYERTRLDYRRWVSDRFLAGFVRPYRAWCERHNLHLVGHFSPEDDPIQEAACLPAAMPIMKAMGWPGCDVIVPAVGDEKSPTLNLGSLRIASLKSQTGRRYCASESQALGDWPITSRETRRIYAWQKVLGVDRFFTHGFWNTMDGVSNLEAPPDYGPNSGVFPGTAAVNAWLERCDAVMDGGTETADVAIVDNILPYWTWAPGMDLDELRKWRWSLWRTVLRALQAHVGVHQADAADIAAGALAGTGGLTVGARTYRTVLVPAGGLMEEAAFQRLNAAAAAGARVVWFGGGPARLRDAAGRLKPAPTPVGVVSRAREPSLAWCRANLPAAAAVSGAAAKECYVRRFRGEDGVERVFAVNIAMAPRVFTLGDDGATAWNPEPDLADGDWARVKNGLRWRVPAGGCGLFTRGAPPAGRMPAAVARPAGAGRVFERLGANTLRLDRCRITLKGRPPQERPYPQPFWQRFNDYFATEMFENFAGNMPVESTVAESDLRYAFRIESRAALKGAVLVLDPRCARGSFTVYWDGRRISDRLVFPLSHIAPLRVPVRTVTKGVHFLELRFDVKNAMEGLLSQVWLEGAFDVRLARGRAVLEASGRSGVSAQGWTAMGLAHYMGEGVYRWTERFAAADLADGAWQLELDGVTDSARLRVNGVELGVRAWAPWRWPLAGLKPGDNAFELIVSSTAGNKVSLRYPAQPQGWLGAARLVRTPGDRL